MQAWDNNVPGKPGERIDDEMQWGVKMEGNSERIRLWAIFRYVPYIPVSCLRVVGHRLAGCMRALRTCSV